MTTEYQSKLELAIDSVFNRLNDLSEDELKKAIKEYAEKNPERVESIRRAMFID